MPPWTAPCRAACPVATDAGGYARLIAEGRLDEAYAVITQSNPFPAVCAHICVRFCEKQCRRSPVDGAVGLRALKRFVVQNTTRPVPPPPPPLGTAARHVAIIGAGPAGLTAAQQLRAGGHRVTLFERLARPGGMLNVIPRYRLPEDALAQDIEAILSTDGIDLQCSTPIGQARSADDLLANGFDSVLVTTGLARSRGMAVPGFGAARFTAAIPWMTDVWLGQKVDMGKRVVVIGGGNVAVDVARTAVRLGADAVTIVCLEPREAMPADPYEATLAEGEGVEILSGLALKRVLNRGEAIAAVELMAVTSLLDVSGRFRPSYDQSRILTRQADMVILSIGQTPDRSWSRDLDLQTDRRGRIVADSDTHQTSRSELFLAGEALRGPACAIEAVADGRHAAAALLAWLSTGTARGPSAAKLHALPAFPSDVKARLHPMPPLEAEAEPHDEAEPALSAADALGEAFRCLGCLNGAVIDADRCASCLTCFRICPLEAIAFDREVRADPARCQACGICASACPAQAIHLEQGAVRPPAPPDGPAPGTVIIRCHHAPEPASETAPATLALPCLARLKVVDLLRLATAGFGTITLQPCAAEDCKYGPAWQNIQTVVDSATAILRTARPEVEVVLHIPAALGPGGRVT